MRFVFPALALTSLACATREISLACRSVSRPADVAARPSPYDSVRFNVGQPAASYSLYSVPANSIEFVEQMTIRAEPA